MHRQPLLDLLERYLALHPDERVAVDHVRQFVRAHPTCFERSCRDGHVTGSAWIVSADHRQVLLTHHRKLGRWLQLGGHADGDTDPLRVALREAREESGLASLAPLSADLGPAPERRTQATAPGDAAPLPLDVDVHLIPARGAEPAHLHHDVRYLLVAAPGQEPVISVESNDLRWFDRAELDRVLDDESLRRLERKARRLLEPAAARRSAARRPL